jgi:hypothetical protein
VGIDNGYFGEVKRSNWISREYEQSTRFPVRSDHWDIFKAYRSIGRDVQSGKHVGLDQDISPDVVVMAVDIDARNSELIDDSNSGRIMRLRTEDGAKFCPGA